jgi:septal ring factor EnvC (AmiA/AmiB activator)
MAVGPVLVRVHASDVQHIAKRCAALRDELLQQAKLISELREELNEQDAEIKKLKDTL